MGDGFFLHDLRHWQLVCASAAKLEGIRPGASEPSTDHLYRFLNSTSPIQFYLQWKNKIFLGEFEGSLGDYFLLREISIGPRIFGWAGYHLWFLGILFACSLVALPIFSWLKGDAGKGLIDKLAAFAMRCGGILIFILPILVAQLIFRPFFPEEHEWADFAYMLVFFIVGYILFADRRFVQAARRDWP